MADSISKQESLHKDGAGFDPTEKYQSQVPAIQALVALGFTPLSQVDADKLRGKERNVVLDDILIDQLSKLNSFSYRGKEYPFDLEDAHEAMRRIKPTRDCVARIKTFTTS